MPRDQALNGILSPVQLLSFYSVGRSPYILLSNGFCSKVILLLIEVPGENRLGEESFNLFFDSIYHFPLLPAKRINSVASFSYAFPNFKAKVTDKFARDLFTSALCDSCSCFYLFIYFLVCF